MARAHTVIRLAAAAVLGLALAGCGRPAGDTPPGGEKAKEKVEAERSKLTPEDRTLVDAQEWCVVSTDERLGSMGPPVKLDIKGQPVFICCKGCKAKAEADPDRTLATLADLKKAKAQKTSP
jgi:hypothetical protein